MTLGCRLVTKLTIIRNCSALSEAEYMFGRLLSQTFRKNPFSTMITESKFFFPNIQQSGHPEGEFNRHLDPFPHFAALVISLKYYSSAS